MATVDWKHTTVRVDQHGIYTTVSVDLSGLRKVGGMDITDRVRIGMFEADATESIGENRDTEKAIRFLREAIRALQSK